MLEIIGLAAYKVENRDLACMEIIIANGNKEIMSNMEREFHDDFCILPLFH